MTNTVLSLYRFFFTDENLTVWAVLKDGRICQMGQTDSFSCFSSDQIYLTGVRFKGENTEFLMRRQPFSAGARIFVFQSEGFCYYPSLLTKKPFRLAFLKADLLHEKGTGTLRIFKQARKKYHLFFDVLAKIAPPVWDEESEKIYFLDERSELCFTDGIKTEKTGISAEFFDIRSSCLAWCSHDTVYIQTPQKNYKFTAIGVTALALSKQGQYLYFATHVSGISQIYLYRLFDGYIKTFHTHACPIRCFSAASF